MKILKIERETAASDADQLRHVRQQLQTAGVPAKDIKLVEDDNKFFSVLLKPGIPLELKAIRGLGKLGCTHIFGLKAGQNISLQLMIPKPEQHDVH
jgi:hypothetical protein